MCNTFRNPSDVNQQWGFSPTGQIYSLSKPNHVMTYVEGHAVTHNPSKPTEPSIGNQEATPSGLENLHLMNDSGLNEQIVGSLDPSAALPDRKEESPESVNLETSLAQLKDEFQGCRYFVVLLPKRQGDATQRLVFNDPNHRHNRAVFKWLLLLRPVPVFQPIRNKIKTKYKVIAKSSDWFFALFALVVIGRSNFFVIGCSTVI